MGNCFRIYTERYYVYKWILHAHRTAEKRRAEKARKKAEKKRLVDTYGYQYYMRDRTWNSIKDQKKRESFDLWQYRLALYGFTINGYDTKNNQWHYSMPLAREFEEKKEEKRNMTEVWNLIADSYSKNPRDVLTYGKRKYFFVYVEENDIYIESGRTHKNASDIKTRRKIDKSNAETIYAAYKAGSKPSELLNVTYNSVYWFGIFRDLGL